MSSLNMPVTLVVKAPNQQIEDQTIQCELSWTIKKLKGYLSEVYPSKPCTEEQKLIYSGHLLHDTSTLREVLRTYGGQQQHTVHLVCAKNSTVSPSARKADIPENGANDGLRRRTSAVSSPSSSSTDRSNASISSTSTSSATVNQPTMSTSAPTPMATPSVPTSQPATASTSSDPNQMWGPFPPGSHFPPFAPFPQTPAYSAYPQMAHWTQAQYAAWMQQAYVQYMAQYMHLVTTQAGGNPFQWPLAASVTSAEVPPTNYEQQAPGQGQGQGQGGNAERGAAEEADDDDNPGQRDWLDWFYLMSRVAVLFSVVYFYSSPMRFIVVFALGLLMYLYQIGFFRPLDDLVADNNNDPARADAAAAQNNNNANNDNNNNNQPAAGLGENGQAAPAQDDPENVNVAGVGTNNAREGVAAEDETDGVERPSIVTLAWTFFTSFFASLIPEQPNVI